MHTLNAVLSLKYPVCYRNLVCRPKMTFCFKCEIFDTKLLDAKAISFEKHVPITHCTERRNVKLGTRSPKGHFHSGRGHVHTNVVFCANA